MATLELKYYKGTDTYSDGDDVEEKLLKIVQENKNLCDLDPSETEFPIYYHLSPVRENICNWYPFKKEAKILEVGSGCGAISGALCSYAEKVVSVELSLRRARINYERHKNIDNLCIYVGNLQDMKELEGKFDYIVLVGVLEYAGKFTNGINPYETFINNLKKYMMPKAKILIAIENRLGMKYFAGAKEDHIGKAFAGLRNYSENVGIRTFSKGELTELLDKCGLNKTTFYYPYPDYKFPVEIFTDETVKTQGFGKPFNVVDEDRISLFPENEISTVFAKEGAAGIIANSFFVEASMTPDESAESVIYAKLNQERKDYFRIGTKILKTDKGGYYVEKGALNTRARQHIEQIEHNEKMVSQYYPVEMGNLMGDKLIYHYLTEKTVKDDLVKQIDFGKNSVIDFIDDFLQKMIANVVKSEVNGKNFEAWFGTETLDGVQECMNPANIDLIPSNIFVEGNSLRVIDCEWVANFPVPKKFVVWRILNNIYYEIPQIHAVVKKEELWTKYDITQRENEIFKKWESHFVNEYCGEMYLTSYRKKIVPMSEERWALFCGNLNRPEGIAGLKLDLNDLRDICWTINGMQFDQMGILKDSIDNYRTLINNMGEKLDRTEIKCKEAEEKFARAKTQREEVEEKLARAETQREEVEEKLIRAETQCEEVEEKLVKVENRYVEMEKELEDLKKKYEAEEIKGKEYRMAYENIIDSSTWKLMKPIRNLKDKLFMK